MPLRFFKTWSLEDIEKRPLVVVIAFLIAINFYMISRKDTREMDCKKETKEWQDKAWNLSIQLLEKNMVIDRKEKEVEKLKSEASDSLVREEVDVPLKNILK